jgi:hypothetical protein
MTESSRLDLWNSFPFSPKHFLPDWIHTTEWDRHEITVHDSTIVSKLRFRKSKTVGEEERKAICSDRICFIEKMCGQWNRTYRRNVDDANVYSRSSVFDRIQETRGMNEELPNEGRPGKSSRYKVDTTIGSILKDDPNGETCDVLDTIVDSWAMKALSRLITSH